MNLVKDLFGWHGGRWPDTLSRQKILGWVTLAKMGTLLGLLPDYGQLSRKQDYFKYLISGPCLQSSILFFNQLKTVPPHSVCACWFAGSPPGLKL